MSQRGGYGSMMPRSHRFFSAIRYLLSPKRSNQRRQNANVPKFSLITFSKCLALGSLQHSDNIQSETNDKKSNHADMMLDLHLLISLENRMWRAAPHKINIFLEFLFWTQVIWDKKKKTATLLAHVQHWSFSCNVNTPCHRALHLFLCCQMSQWRKFHLPERQ